MTKDEIIRIAEQAGFKVFGDRVVAADGNCSGLATESVIRFAGLVAVACANEIESMRTETGWIGRAEAVRKLRALSNKGE